MTLQELRFLVALAKERHFHKASQACFVSQPTLSIAIRKLENELGIELFERHKNSVRITVAGQDIVARAKRVLAEVDEIKQVALSDKDQLRAVFKLGAIYTIGPYLLPPLITALHHAAPLLTIEIQENFTANLREKLLSGELDAILISLPFGGPGIVTHTLYKEDFVVLMPKNHALAKFKSIPEKALSNYNVLMLGEGHCFRDQVMSSCPRCFSDKKSISGVNWRTVEGGSLETIRHMVASGMGLTILPSSAVSLNHYYENILTFRPLKAVSPSRTVALAWRNSFTRVKAIDAVLKAITNCKIPAILK